MTTPNPKRPSDAPTTWLNQTFTITIDRPLGSTHPKHPTIIYPINYGYIPNTLAADGHEIDAYILGIDAPITTFTGQCIAIIHRLDDVEDKLIIAPSGQAYTDTEITAQTDFQEQYFKTRLIR